MTGDQLLAKHVYKTFLEKEGNDYIAGDYSLFCLFRLIRRFKVRHVLELGLGIGCIGYGVMEYAKKNNISINYVGTEDNAFCLEALEKNLAAHRSHIQISHHINNVTSPVKFDLIIVDGSDDNLAAVKELIAFHGILFVEGARASQLKALYSYFPRQCQVQMVTARKNPADTRYSNNGWYGGGTLIFIRPTFAQKFFYWKEKISTSIKFRIRRKMMNCEL